MLSPLQRCLADAPRHGFTRRDLTRMGACATGELGTHLRRCDHCGAKVDVPNACRERACPFCRQRERAEWVRARERELPPVPYFHAVFTVPAELRPLAAADPRVFHGLLLDSARGALLHICADPRHLGVVPAMFAVLHTWNQRLNLHPHVHVVVSAGGLASDGRWIHAGSTRQRAFLVPQPVLRARFQTLLIRGILHAFDHGRWHALPSAWRERHALHHGLIALRRKRWGVHLERPLSGPQALVRYLATYVNRVAIAPRRVVSYDGERVTFTWKDRRDGGRERQDVLPAAEFLRRFVQHLPPRGFVRIRFWGLLAHRRRADLQTQAQSALAAVGPGRHASGLVVALPRPADDTVPLDTRAGLCCPICQCGVLRYIGERTITPSAPPPTPARIARTG